MASTNLNLPSKLSLKGNLSVNWKKFRQQFEIYMLAANLSSRKPAAKVALLLNLIGEEALEVYNNFEKSEDSEESLDTVLDKFEKYCNPKKNVLHSRYLFYSRHQKPGERFDSFFTEVKMLAADCEFSNKDDNLRDRLVFGSTDTKVQQKLIKEGNVSLEKAIEALRIGEITRDQANQVLENSVAVAEVKKLSTSATQSASTSKDSRHWSSKPSVKRNQPEVQLIKCSWCGKEHERVKEQCPAYGKTCSKCKGRNHFPSV